MGQQIFWEMFGAGVLGMLVNITRKWASQRSKAIQANVHVSLKEYIRLDCVAWLATVLAIGACMMAVKYWLDWQPWVIRAVLPLFICLGYMGSDLLVSWLGVFNKYVNRIIDVKTSVADKMAGTLKTPTPVSEGKPTITDGNV